MSVDDRPKPPAVRGVAPVDLTPADEARLWAGIVARRSDARVERKAEDARAALPRPVAKVLKPGEALLGDRSQAFRGVRARSARTASPRKRRARHQLVLAGAGALLALVWVAGAALWRTPPEQGKLAAAHVAGPLALRGGAPLAELEARERAALVELSDASSIRLSPGTRIVPLVSTGTSVELLLEQGSAVFSVKPGGPRRWIVDAGRARVEVVGTVFRVERRAERVVVEVRRGAVLVRGEAVPGLVRKLEAGERLALASPKVTAPEEPTKPAEVAEPAAVPSAPVTHAAAPVERVAHPAQAAPVERAAAAGASPTARRTAFGAAQGGETIESLLHQADAARLAGHPEDAVGPLERALSEFASSPHAALAAFTLGRLRLEQLEQPRPAAAAFETALKLGLPRALQPDCHRRLIDAYEQLGDHQAAKRTLEELVQSFPESARDDELDRWLEP